MPGFLISIELLLKKLDKKNIIDYLNKSLNSCKIFNENPNQFCYILHKLMLINFVLTTIFWQNMKKGKIK